ncbi:MAG: DUF3987 domain-containing protein [Hyphomicrobiaceae bacterium]
MEHANGKPGARGTGFDNRAFAGGRNGSGYSGCGRFGQRTAADEKERSRSALEYIYSRDNATWLKVGMAIKAEFGEDGWSIFDEWSRRAENYDAKVNRTRWRSFKTGGGITIASLYGMARDNGWRDDGTYRVPDLEEVAARARKRAEQETKARTAKAAGADRASKKAMAIWSMASPATADNPYLQRKGVPPTETLREIDMDKVVAVYGHVPKVRESEPLEGNLTVVPIKVAGKLSSVQLIDPAGRKHFQAGSAIGGGYWAAQALPDGDGTGRQFQIGEGVATVQSARHAVPGALGVSAMSNGNIPSVARQMRECYPGADIVVLADLDKKTGEPDNHAVEAARAIGGRLAVPQFSDGPAPDRKDFNDLARVHGAEAVRRAIEAAHSPGEGEGTRSGSNGTAGWPQPLPLFSKIELEPYPLDALPPGLREAVEEVTNYMRAPLPLVASCSLSALSLTCQHLIDVRRDAQLCGPVSLFFMTVAESGERKTRADSFFMEPLREWQRKRADEMKPEIDAFRAAHAAWTSECEGSALRSRRRQRRESHPTT